MLNNPAEYEQMSLVEQNHWWYKSLHYFTKRSIQNNFTDKNITIIDAGCGTGGMIRFLNTKGYHNIKGIDVSEFAVAHCKEKKISVSQESILNIDKLFEANTADVIICNDVIYFFSDEEQKNIIDKFYSILKSNGIIIMNIPSLNAFKGNHDISVGIKNRISKKEAEILFDDKLFQIKNSFYWPFWASPIIFLVRLFQRLKKHSEIKSDLSVLPKWINALLYFVTLVEYKLLPFKPWGSSVFIVAKKIG